MSYGNTAALQAAVYQRLASVDALMTLTGGHIYDALPAGTPPELYVTLGAEKVRDASDGSGGGAWHDFTVAVITEGAGFQAAKDAAAEVSDALVDAPLSLSRGSLVSLRFLRARARRESGGLRRIEMTFRARVSDD
ncbi:DUF3168 domain-containing protein [Thalassococcus profundi]|uniref:DUF3168 domain-containing protein n=1 Tax=Thalassococcus profundi TaxID=2282382 RepID=A0A369TQL0_9RHOB|nr:DUF3168 domain-containing protein [Thalassococcus profundi]RDD67004.1 DUF3168 domain-containing protein [Thalassococcus profundi]